MSFTIEVIGLEATQALLRGDELYREPVAELMGKVTVLGQREAVNASPRDTGALVSSIHGEAQPLEARVFSTSPHALPVEGGRRVGAGMPPPDALRSWMQRHGLGDVSPFVIARAIQRRGIRGRFFFAKARKAIEQALPDYSRKALEEIGARWAK